MRVLASSTPNAGHYAPLLPVLKAFVEKGDEVRVVASPALAEVVEASGLPYQAAPAPPADELAAIWAQVPTVSRSEAAVLVNREIFGRLDTEALLPMLEELCTTWRPDLLVHEPAEFAAAVASARTGISHVQVAIGLASVEAASIRIAEPVLVQYGAGFVENLLRAPYLSRFPATLDPSTYHDTRRFREREPESSAALPDHWGGSTAPLVYASFGTVAGRLPVGEIVYASALRALAELPVRGLLTTGRTRDVSTIGSPPDHVHVASWVDQAAAIRAASVVVCHGGAGTTFGALAAGKPLVVVPLMADQPTNGRIAAAAGAAVVVPPEDPEDPATPLEIRLRRGIHEVISNPSFTEAAARVAKEMSSMADLDDVVDGLRSLRSADPA